MVLAFLLWTSNQFAWTVLEVFRHRPIPDPFFFDVVLFFHAVPMIAAIAWRPDLLSQRGKILSGLNFLMLLGWWIFLYAFIVFPHQYVVLDVEKYNVYYDGLYAVENALLVGVLIRTFFPRLGIEICRVPARPPLEEFSTAAGHAGHPVVAGAGALDHPPRPLTGSHENLPHLRRPGRHVAVGMLGLPPSVSRGPDPDVATVEVPPCL